MKDDDRSVPNPAPEPNPEGDPNLNPAPTPTSGSDVPLETPTMQGIMSMLAMLGLPRAPREVQMFFAEWLLGTSIEVYEAALADMTSREGDFGEPRPSVPDLFKTARYTTYATLAEEVRAVAVQMAGDDDKRWLTMVQLGRYIGGGRSAMLSEKVRQRFERLQRRS